MPPTSSSAPSPSAASPAFGCATVTTTAWTALTNLPTAVRILHREDGGGSWPLGGSAAAACVGLPVGAESLLGACGSTGIGGCRQRGSVWICVLVTLFWILPPQLQGSPEEKRQSSANAPSPYLCPFISPQHK